MLNNLLIESIEDLQNAVICLHKENLGKASFYLLHGDTKQKRSILENLTEFSLKRKAKKIIKISMS